MGYGVFLKKGWTEKKSFGFLRSGNNVFLLVTGREVNDNNDGGWEMICE